MRNLFLAALAVSVISACLTGNANAANLVLNGSFETGPEINGFLSLDTGSTAISEWTVTRGSIDYYEDEWVSSDGNRSLDLNGTPGVGGVAQTINTTPGQTYEVSFDLAGHPSGLLQQMRVAAAGQIADFSFQSGTNPNNLGWQRSKWLFTANAPETTLEFYSLQSSYKFGGPALDNVSVTVAAVPEPTTTLGILMFGAIATEWRRRRYRKV